MIKRVYTCDICRGDFTDKTAELFGIYWLGVRFVYKHYIDCEHHLCAECLISSNKVYESLKGQITKLQNQ